MSKYVYLLTAITLHFDLIKCMWYYKFLSVLYQIPGSAAVLNRERSEMKFWILKQPYISITFAISQWVLQDVLPLSFVFLYDS